jgi:hypothetical protein
MYPVSNAKVFKFEVCPSQIMFPKARMVVFYINDEGIIISDEVTLNVEKPDHVSKLKIFRFKIN